MPALCHLQGDIRVAQLRENVVKLIGNDRHYYMLSPDPWEKKL